MYIEATVRECAVKMSKAINTYSERTINIDKTIQFNPHTLIMLESVLSKCQKAINIYSERTINIDKTIQFNPRALIKLLHIKK